MIKRSKNLDPSKLRYAIFPVKWGYFGLLGDSEGLIATSLPAKSAHLTRKYLLVGLCGDAKIDDKLFMNLQKKITAYYKGCYVDFTNAKISLNSLELSEFSQNILKFCQKIQFGETVSYGQLAARARCPKAARAVGTALAGNPMPLIIPCHRIIRADGIIGNFSAPGGGKTKAKMLDLEKKTTKKHKI